jgi:uncharacterized protein YegP (UPF0339 family)
MGDNVTGETYKAPSGQWSWRVLVDGEQVAGGAGYRTKLEAEADMQAEQARSEQGVVWWNALSEEERAFWLRAAMSAVPADAWAYYQRVCAS